MQVVSNGQSADVLKFSAALSAKMGTKTGQRYENVSQQVLQCSVRGNLAGYRYSKYKLWRTNSYTVCLSCTYCIAPSVNDVRTAGKGLRE